MLESTCSNNNILKIDTGVYTFKHNILKVDAGVYMFKQQYFKDWYCSTASYKTDNENLPSPHLSYQDLMDLFATEFGFNADEVVALLGIHTLEGAETFNSGFKGSRV